MAALLVRYHAGHAAARNADPMISCRPQDYRLGEPIGYGASSVVYLSKFYPLAEAAPFIVCAVKVIDVDRLSKAADIDRLRRETQLMALSKHTNVVRVRGEWIEGSKLFIAVRYMSPGSMLDICRYGWTEGFDEVVIATVLKQAIAGLKCTSSSVAALTSSQICIRMDGCIGTLRRQICSWTTTGRCCWPTLASPPPSSKMLLPVPSIRPSPRAERRRASHLWGHRAGWRPR